MRVPVTNVCMSQCKELSTCIYNMYVIVPVAMTIMYMIIQRMKYLNSKYILDRAKISVPFPLGLTILIMHFTLFAKTIRYHQNQLHLHQVQSGAGPISLTQTGSFVLHNLECTPLPNPSHAAHTSWYNKSVIIILGPVLKNTSFVWKVYWDLQQQKYLTCTKSILGLGM